MQETDTNMSTRDRIVAGVAVMAILAFLTGPWTWQKLVVLIGVVYVVSWLKAKAMSKLWVLGDG